jgi:type IV pilus assembly protein PilW
LSWGWRAGEPPGAAGRSGARRSADRRRPRREEGFTLIELLVAMTASIVLLGGVLVMLTSSQRIQTRDGEWALTMQEGRVGLDRMVSEIRQASTVSSAGGNAIDFLATFEGQKKQIYYNCEVSQAGTSFKECVRVAANEGSPLPALSSGQVIVRDVLNDTASDPSDPVFSYTPDAIAPTVATLKLTLPAGGTLSGSAGYSHKVVLTDDAFMRNTDLQG